MISIVIASLISAAIGFLFGKYVSSQPKTKPRRGIIQKHFVGSGTANTGKDYPFTFTVSELEDLGDYTKIKIENVSGISDKYALENAKLVLGDVVPSKDIKWFDALILPPGMDK